MSTLSPKGRALVRASQRAFRPTDADRTRLASALRSQLGDAALPANLGPMTAATSAVRAVWPVVSVVVAGAAILGGSLYFARHRGTAQNHPDEAKIEANVATIAATMPVLEPVVAPAAEAPAIPDRTLAAAELLDTPTLSATSAHRPQDRLASEVAILSHATRELHAGRATEALKSLDEYHRKFPKGLLSEEQCAARAQALCALGRFDEANTKLAGLSPQSPLAVRAKQFCGASPTPR